MPNEPVPPSVEIRFTPEFKRNLRALSKRYPHIRSDLEPTLEQLQAGDLVGDRLQRVGYTLFKARVRNCDARRSKSGGYRLIYYLQEPKRLVLITIYSKSEQSDIAAAAVRRIIREFEEETS